VVLLNETLVVIVRGIIGFFTLLIFTRLLGKEQVGQLTFFDYIMGITIGSIAASLTVDLGSRAWPHWVGLLTWTVAALSMQWITIRWRYISKIIEGEPVVVIMNGKIMEDTMKKIRYRLSDLLVQLRDKGVFDLSHVEFAVLETDGKLSVLKKSQLLPVTPRDLNISTNYFGISSELIYDGVVIEENLKQVNLSPQWLESELQKQGISHPSQVFLASLNTTGELYIDTYKDYLKRIVDISDYPGPN